MDKSKSAKEGEAWVKLLTSTAASLVMMITPLMMIAYNVYYVKSLLYQYNSSTKHLLFKTAAVQDAEAFQRGNR